MGVYYRSISTRSKTIDGVKIAFTNFYGKAPSVFSDNTSHWDRFCTRASNSAAAVRGQVEYVTTAEPVGSMGKHDEFAVACWSGQSLLDDGFWDNNHVGVIRKVRGRWRLVLDQKEEEQEEEWSPYTCDFNDPGSYHHW